MLWGCYKSVVTTAHDERAAEPLLRHAVSIRYYLITEGWFTVMYHTQLFEENE